MSKGRRTKLFALLCIAIVSASALSCRIVSISRRSIEPEDVQGLWLFDSIEFEIAPVTSYDAADSAALERFRILLHDNQICPYDSVSFVIREASGSLFPGLWTAASLQAYSIRHRTHYDADPSDRKLSVFVAYIPGLWLDPADGIKLLGGIQYGESSFAVFKDGVGAHEEGVLLHEFGHLINLCDPDTHPTPDRVHKYHCANPVCAMYWTTPYGSLQDFDAPCKQMVRRLILQSNDR